MSWFCVAACVVCASHTTTQGAKRLCFLFFFFMFSCLVLGQKCDVYNGQCSGHYSFTMCTALSDSVPDFLHSEADCIKQVIGASVQNSSLSFTF